MACPSRRGTTACGRTAPTSRIGWLGCRCWCSAPWPFRTVCWSGPRTTASITASVMTTKSTRTRQAVASGTRTSVGCCATTQAPRRISTWSKTSSATRCCASNTSTTCPWCCSPISAFPLPSVCTSAISGACCYWPVSRAWSSATTSPSSSIRSRTCGAPSPTTTATAPRTTRYSPS